MTKQACKDCRFWVPEAWWSERRSDVEPTDHPRLGECRRYAPPPKHLPPPDVRYEVLGDCKPRSPGICPSLTAPDYWCGEFKPRDIAGGVNFDTLQNYADFEENLAIRLRNMLHTLGIKGWDTFCSAFAQRAEGSFDPTKRSHIAAVAMRERNIGKTLSQGLIDHLERAGWPFRE